MISAGKSSLTKQDFTNKVSEADILGFYLGITHIPIVMSSPLRKDEKPSFALYSPNGKEVNYIDFSTGDRGNCISLLMKLWNKDYTSTCERIQREIVNPLNIKCKGSNNKFSLSKVKVETETTELQCKIREWMPYDIEYWGSFGIPLKVLKWAEVYPISHKIIIKNGKKMIFRTDKYAYTFVERKEGRITHKFYQPFNKNGYKWQNNHDKSVLGLWTKMPVKGAAVCICSSVKDALCLMTNVHIPCICLQGEGYSISDTAIKELRKRFIDIYICLDNDETGLKDSKKLAEDTGFINVIIPPFDGGKDISDYFKLNGEKAFKSLFSKLFIDARYEFYNELPPF